MSNLTTAPARLNADPERLQKRLDTFAALSEPGSGPGVTRLAYTPLEREAHAVFADEMRSLGLTVRTDAAGNTIAERAGTVPGLPALGTGSHLDSVPNAGAYDGIAGVVAAMETARLYRDHDVAHAHPVRFVAFAAEEGARFGQACTGSRIVSGLTAAQDLADKQDADGITLADALRSVGLPPEAVGAARWEPADWAAFVELHIEQGGVLEAAGTPIGVVDLISGSTRLLLEVTGRASHTGGTPMHLRADAMAAAAEIVLLIESLANDTRHHGTRATVGRLQVEPGSITTIAGKADLYVDVRDVDSDRQRLTAAEIVERAQALCVRRGVGLTARALADASPVILPGWVRETLADTCRGLGVDHRVLPSGASHDAQMVNHVVPTGMVFVPSREGISHSPLEWTGADELALGADVLAAGLLELDRRLAAARDGHDEREENGT
ncbi:Zn-dependent hydrolase [Streptomyces sp. PKU-EA00015]|uniref:Zn-dependent hydrolase n=1 Tax=Streptomyces sp. PKU-EA00015 TaxID=2748326 RepID=UPI0015A432CE|nr:Zn-dependent hydrolase [Streptomyces sp. PKU-EA00015]NWF29759.1 Zn-dependent hydrolase [Streptomyces sp. PKU-EA00015]